MSILYINVSKAEDVLGKNIVTFQEILERPDNLQLNLLYAITAGIAASKPKAVANKASAIPGATIAKLVFLEIAID